MKRQQEQVSCNMGVVASGNRYGLIAHDMLSQTVRIAWTQPSPNFHMLVEACKLQRPRCFAASAMIRSISSGAEGIFAESLSMLPSGIIM